MIKTDYETLLLQLESLMEDQKYTITLLSNASALLNEALDDINWVGFYLNCDGKLILGPFQGLVACQEIAFENGVCGAAATTLSTQLVKNVHEFPGHIACDSRSNSEIVVPIIINDELYGVLDIDSPSMARFDEEDQVNLEKAVEIMSTAINKIINA